MTKNRTVRFLAGFPLLALAGLIASACDTPMGMGPPVDTTAPIISINTPSDNEFIRGVMQGSPVTMTGSWVDDFGVTSLRFEIYNKTAGSPVKPDDLTYTIDPDGKWRAGITITARGATADEYNIKVYAADSFANTGMAQVNVRIDIVPPWVRDAQTARHTKSGFNFSSPVYRQEHYEADGYRLAQAYRNITYNKLDEYQNEVFTLRVEIEPSYADVAASRLYVKDGDGAQLHSEGLPPTGYWQEGDAEQRFPEWEITASQMESWRPSFRAGAHYIFFEVWAWSEAAWDRENNQPFPGEPGRAQKIDGTVWYPESDYPHAYINPENFTNDIVLLEPDRENGLVVDFYDDDRLGVIYSQLITKQAFDALAGADEEGYLNSLTDPADAGGKRADLISTLGLTNAFAASSGDNRFQSVDNGTLGLSAGEYRLIALARDDKSVNGYAFEAGAEEKWSVYPPVKIQIQSADAPFIFVENPERENVFPQVPDGSSFAMSGYTLGRMETAALHIAWVPKALQSGGLNNAITVLESAEASALNPGGSFTAANGIKVWKLAPRQAAGKTTLNGVQYFRADFANSFHIINDFQYNSALENEDKLFVIHAGNFSAQTYQTFNLPGLKDGPDVEVTSHRRGAGHDPNEDLTLRMRVDPSSYGVAVVSGSQIITDITGLSDSDAGFSGPTALAGSEWARTVPGAYIRANYYKGETRKYAFRARDILGNATQHEREISMTDQPLLQSISCSSEPGTYGIGTVLRFEALFSMPVRVTWEAGSAPKLKLYLTDPGNGTNVSTGIWADYDIETPIGNTVFFSYTVLEGHTTNLLCTSLDAIELNGALLTSYSYEDADIVLASQDGSLQDNKAIRLDGERPTITRASFAPLSGYTYSGISYFTNGKTITLKLTTGEPVRVSGSPQAVIRYGASQTQLKAQYSSKTVSASGSETLYFTHTVNDSVSGVSNTIPLTRLEWGEPWLDMANNSAITDLAGNDIVSADYASLSAADRQGQASGAYPSEQGYIKTTLPATPRYSLHRTSADAQNNANAVAANPFLTNADIYVRITGGDVPDANGLGGSRLFYSLYGGDYPRTVSGTTGTGTDTITDANIADRYLPTYEKSNYSVVAWQEDLAGNRSALSPARPVTISSRFPELISIDIGIPDGAYRAGVQATFRLNFSDKVRVTSGDPRAAIDFYRPVSGTYQSFNTNSGIALYRDTTDQYSSQLSLDWTAAGTGVARDIKVGKILFSAGSLQDEYGNAQVNYEGTAAESAGNNRRPIGFTSAYTFNVNRPGLEFRFDAPYIVSASPQLPTASGEYYNGGIASGRTFTLTFDVPVTRVSGAYITVRPYGQWALPPVMSVTDFNALLNHPAVINSPEYTRRLTYVDARGEPINATMYSGYAKTTHGLKDTGGYVRPDTATKWVLRFDVDPYRTDANSSIDMSARLREVFNAAQWKWQRVHAASGQVQVNGAVATVTLVDDLLPGRIWEVLVDDGAFCDAGGNPCLPVTAATNDTGGGAAANNAGGTGYRFWSAGTAAPVVRVNRVSYHDTMEDDSNPSYNRSPPLPDIDTEVRIDCETPGAAIRYDVIRTRFLPSAAAGTTNTDGVSYNSIFTSTDATDAGFFGSPLQITAAGETGYKRNSIGYSDDHLTARDANNFFNTLLVPNVVQTGSATLSNGAPQTSSLTATAAAAVSAVTGGTGANAYRTVDGAGAAAYGTYVYGTAPNRYFYAGEAYQSGSKTVSSHADSKLYSGRRDYVAAAARKNAVNNSGSDDGKRFAGPQLAASTAGTEGVYKTTAIYRNPTGSSSSQQQLLSRHAEMPPDYLTRPGMGRLRIGGFDMITPDNAELSILEGFPFKRKTEMLAYTFAYFPNRPERYPNPCDGQHVHNVPAEYDLWGNLLVPAFSHNYLVRDFEYPLVLRNDIDNNYLWVSWEIITDWYQDSAASPYVFYLNFTFVETPNIAGCNNSVNLQLSTRGINGSPLNGNMITATYGGLTYRFEQEFIAQRFD